MLPMLSTLATVSGTVSGLLPLLQIARMMRTRTASGVSLAYLAGGLANAAAFASYGIARGDATVVSANLLWLATGSAMVATAVHFRRSAARPEQAPEPDPEPPATEPAPPLELGDAPTLIMQSGLAAAV